MRGALQVSVFTMLTCSLGLCVYFGALTGICKWLGIAPGTQAVVVVNRVPLLIVWFLGISLFVQFHRQGRPTAWAGILALALFIGVQFAQTALGIWTVSLARANRGGFPSGPTVFNLISTSSSYAFPWVHAVAWCLFFWTLIDHAENKNSDLRRQAHWAVLLAAAFATIVAATLAYKAVANLSTT